MSEENETPKSLGHHMVHGSIWTIGLRWAIRLTGLISTILLARLLTPADFGIVAIAMLVVGTIEVFSQTGQRLAIIRHENPTREHYDAAWTISIGVGLVLATIILLIAPFTQQYFHEPKSVAVMQALALRALLGGAENIGVVDFRRDLRFEKFFAFSIIAKATSFCVTLGLAFWLQNYWALVAGIISGQLASNIASYVMHPYRPRISFTKIPEIWVFSSWTLLKSIGIHLNANVDVFAIGGFSGAASMGRYTVASDIATSPTVEINDPMISVLFPVMAKAQGDRQQVRELYLRVMSWSAIICCSTSVGISLIAEDFVAIVLGPQWKDVTPLVPWLALAAGVLGLSSGAYTTFDTLGEPRRSARLQWARLILLTLVIAPVAVITQDLETIALSRLIAISAFMPSLLLVVGRFIGVSFLEYFVVLWRPFFAAGIMATSVFLVNSGMVETGVTRILVDVGIGATTYILTLVACWRLSGSPNGPELDIVNFFCGLPKRLN